MGNQGQPTADVYVAWLLAAAAPGVWLGHCARDALVWPGAVLVPAYTRTLCGTVVAGAGVALALSSIAASVGGLALWASLAYGALAVAATLLAAFHFRYIALVALLVVGLALTLMIQDAATLVPAVAQRPLASGVAALAGAVLLACFLHGVSSPLAERRQPFANGLERGAAWLGRQFQSDAIASPRWRVFGLFGVAAIVAAAASRSGALGEHSLGWLFLTGVLVWTIFAGQSSSFPHGHLAAAASLLLLGAGKTRADVGRQIMWRTAGDSFLGAGVFTAVSLVLGETIHLSEVLVALAACHLYTVAASGSKWLLSSRGSVLVAMPFVLFLAWLGSRLLPAGLLIGAAALVASAATAVYWGGRRMGRLDFA